MMNKPILNFIAKLALLSAPIILLVVFYVTTDPFKVVYKYSAYYESGKPSTVILNRDYVSTEMFLKNDPVYHYEAFIFGNSRSLFWQIEDWKSYIRTDQCFHFDASGESIYGIYQKFNLLTQRKVSIKHAIIILDSETLKTVENSRGHLLLKHPLLSGQSWLSFQMEYLKTFFSGKFLLAYIDYKLTGKIKPYMTENYILDNRPMDYDIKWNQIKFTYFEKIISDNRDSYYEPRSKIFFSRDQVQEASPAVISDKQKEMLLTIRKIFEQNHTDYRIVINPLYDQKKFSQIDLEYLKTLFGKDHVFDFSGINSITRDKYNYYEESHYRPQVSRKMLSVMYSEKDSPEKRKNR